MLRNLFITITVFILGAAAAVLALFGVSYVSGEKEQQLLQAVGIQKPDVIGFVPYWLLDKTQASYDSLLTTVTYFGLVVGNDGHITTLTNPGEEEPGWRALKLGKFRDTFPKKEKNSLHLSLLVHTANEQIISELLSDPTVHAQNLMSDVVPIMEEHGFSDLNLDIESFVDASPAAQLAYTTFVREVRNAIDREALGTLTIELTPMAVVRPRITDPVEIAKLADTVVLMAYDYHYLSSFNSGPVAPIGGAGSVREYDVETAIRETLNVIPREKLRLGIPLYGYEWETLADKPGAAVVPGSGKTASNSRVTELLSQCPDCTQGIDPIAQVPYVTFPEGKYMSQIYYDDAVSLGKKLALAEKYFLGGVAFWALGYESDTMLVPLSSYTTSLQYFWE